LGFFLWGDKVSQGHAKSGGSDHWELREVRQEMIFVYKSLNRKELLNPLFFGFFFQFSLGMVYFLEAVELGRPGWRRGGPMGY
jgi:hypothetical protein